MVRRPPSVIAQLRRWRAGQAPACPDDAVTAAAAHKLAPLFWQRDKTTALRRYVMASTARWAEIEVPLRDTLTALATQVELMPLRALDYAFSLYDARELRPFNDFDLLVRSDDFDRAAACLITLGFRTIHDARGVAGHQEHYAWQFVRNSLSIDLHRGIRQLVRAAIDYDAIWSHAAPSQRLGVAMKQPDPVDRTLLHVAHQAGHEFVGPLIAFADLELLLAQPRLDRRELHDRAAHYGLSRALHTALQLRSRLWGEPHAAAPWPGAWPSLARQASASYRVFRPLQLARKLSLLDDWSYRLAFARYAASTLQPRRQGQQQK